MKNALGEAFTTSLESAKWKLWHGHPQDALTKLALLRDNITDEGHRSKLRGLYDYLDRNQAYLVNSDVVFWRVPSELTSRQARLLLGKQRAKEIFCSLPELESFVRIQDQRLHECLGLLTTRFPNGFDG